MLFTRPSEASLLSNEKLIRIHGDEYAGIPEAGLFTHFNLATASHQVGERYIIARIIRPGCDTTTEPPVLEFSACPVGICIGFDPVLSYDDLSNRHFQGSMRHIQSPADLRDRIIARYQRSRPHLSVAEIIAMGVSRTVLQLERTAKGPLLSGECPRSS